MFAQPVEKIKIPFLHQSINPRDLAENGMLYSEAFINKIKLLDLPLGVITNPEQLQLKGLESAKYGVLKTENKCYCIKALPDNKAGLNKYRNTYVLTETPPQLSYIDHQAEPHNLLSDALKCIELNTAIKNQPDFNSEKPLSKTVDSANLQSVWDEITKSPRHNRYEYFALAKNLGSGGFGKVDIGQNLRSGKFVAIKTIKAFEEAQKAKKIARAEKNILRNTGQLQAAFLQPEENSTEVFIMDLQNGHTVEELLHSRKPISLARRLDIAVATLEAIQELHQKRILHCDIKPENIIFRNGRANLVDFGLAKVASEDSASLSAPAHASGGTFTYIAPELLSTGYNEKTECFAAGKTLVEIIGFAKEELSALGMKISLLPLDDPKIQVIKQNPDDKIPACLWHCLNAMANDNPEVRPSLSEMISYLKNIRTLLLPSALVSDTAYVEVNAFDEKNLIPLFSKEEVILVDQAEFHEKNRMLYQLFRQLLEKQGVQVRDEVLSIKDKSSLETIQQDMIQRQAERQRILECTWFSQNIAHPIQVFLEPNQIKQTILILQHEVDQLTKSQGQLAAGTVAALTDFMETMTTRLGSTPPTFKEFHRALETLQQTITENDSVKKLLQNMLKELENQVSSKFEGQIPKNNQFLNKLEKYLLGKINTNSLLDIEVKKIKATGFFSDDAITQFYNTHQAQKNDAKKMKHLAQALTIALHELKDRNMQSLCNLALANLNLSKNLKSEIDDLKYKIEELFDDEEPEISQTMIEMLLRYQQQTEMLMTPIAVLANAGLLNDSNMEKINALLNRFDDEDNYGENLDTAFGATAGFKLSQAHLSGLLRLASDPDKLEAFADFCLSNKSKPQTILEYLNNFCTSPANDAEASSTPQRKFP